MTNTELKELIDEQITDVVITGGVSNVNEGGRMKDIVDYTDQEVLVNKLNIDSNATNIGLCTKDADTDVSSNDWVLDEDDMSSDSDTKVPTQQSVKAYVDANSGNATLGGVIANGNTYIPDSDNTWTWDADQLKFIDTANDKGWYISNNLFIFTDSLGDNTGKTYIKDDRLVIGNGTYRGSISATLLTTARNFQLPDSSGTFALTRDVALEWNAQVFQSGTDNPIPQTPQTNTLIVGSIYESPLEFRDISFERTGVGTFKIRVRYTSSTVPTSTNKLSLSFGDAVCYVTGSSTGSIGGGTPYNYKEWIFETRTAGGTLFDGLLLGNNGGYINIKLYP